MQENRKCCLTSKTKNQKQNQSCHENKQKIYNHLSYHHSRKMMVGSFPFFPLPGPLLGSQGSNQRAKEQEAEGRAQLTPQSNGQLRATRKSLLVLCPHTSCHKPPSEPNHWLQISTLTPK